MDKEAGNINHLIVSKDYAEYDPMTKHFIDIIIDANLFNSNSSDDSDWEDDLGYKTFDAASYLLKKEQTAPLLTSDNESEQEVEWDIQFCDEDICKWVSIY